MGNRRISNRTGGLPRSVERCHGALNGKPCGPQRRPVLQANAAMKSKPLNRHAVRWYVIVNQNQPKNVHVRQARGAVASVYNVGNNPVQSGRRQTAGRGTEKKKVAAGVRQACKGASVVRTKGVSNAMRASAGNVLAIVQRNRPVVGKNSTTRYNRYTTATRQNC